MWCRNDKWQNKHFGCSDEDDVIELFFLCFSFLLSSLFFCGLGLTSPGLSFVTALLLVFSWLGLHWPEMIVLFSRVYDYIICSFLYDSTKFHSQSSSSVYSSVYVPFCLHFAVTMMNLRTWNAELFVGIWGVPYGTVWYRIFRVIFRLVSGIRTVPWRLT